MKIPALIFFALTCTASFAIADESMPLLYTRSSIAIARAALQAAPLPWQKPEEAQAATQLLLDVEIREAATFYSQKGWFNLSSPSEAGGVLLAFSSPTMAPIIASSQYTPLDILMIDDKGVIISILPNLMLSELSEDMYPPRPILAFLFLKGGACEKLSIRPGDIIDYKLFKKPPTMLLAPESAGVAPPQIPIKEPRAP